MPPAPHLHDAAVDRHCHPMPVVRPGPTPGVPLPILVSPPTPDCCCPRRQLRAASIHRRSARHRPTPDRLPLPPGIGQSPGVQRHRLRHPPLATDVQRRTVGHRRRPPSVLPSPVAFFGASVPLLTFAARRRGCCCPTASSRTQCPDWFTTPLPLNDRARVVQRIAAVESPAPALSDHRSGEGCRPLPSGTRTPHRCRR